MNIDKDGNLATISKPNYYAQIGKCIASYCAKLELDTECSAVSIRCECSERAEESNKAIFQALENISKNNEG